MASDINKGIFTCLGGRENGSVRPWEIFDVARGSSNCIKRLGKWRVLTGHDGCVNTVAWNEQGSTILSGSDDCKLNIFHVGRNKILHSLQSGHRANIFSAKFLPYSSDKKVVSCCGSGMIHYNEVGIETLYGHNYFNCHAGTTYEVAVTPGDPNSFMTCGEDGTVRHYDLRVKSKCYCQECRENILVECGHAVTSLCVNPMNPYHLAIGCEDSFVRVYDIRTLGAAKERGYFRRTRKESPGLICCFKPPNLKKETCRVTSLRYSNDGKDILVSYCTDYVYLFSMDEAYRLLEEKKLEQENRKCGANGDGNNQQSSSLPSMKRLRLRGDWSDTGPNARPETDQEPRENQRASDMNLALMQRIYGVFSRSLEEAFNLTSSSITDEDEAQDDLDENENEVEEETQNEAQPESEAAGEDGARIEVQIDSQDCTREMDSEDKQERESEEGSCRFDRFAESPPIELASSSANFSSLRGRGLDQSSILDSKDTAERLKQCSNSNDARTQCFLHTEDINDDFATRLANDITFESIQAVGRGMVPNKKSTAVNEKRPMPKICNEQKTVSYDLSSVNNDNERENFKMSCSTPTSDKNGDDSNSGFQLSVNKSQDFGQNYENSSENQMLEDIAIESVSNRNSFSGINEFEMISENATGMTKNVCYSNGKSSSKNTTLNDSNSVITTTEYNPFQPNIYASNFPSNSDISKNFITAPGSSVIGSSNPFFEGGECTDVSYEKRNLSESESETNFIRAPGSSVTGSSNPFFDGGLVTGSSNQFLDGCGNIIPPDKGHVSESDLSQIEADVTSKLINDNSSPRSHVTEEPRYDSKTSTETQWQASSSESTITDSTDEETPLNTDNQPPYEAASTRRTQLDENVRHSSNTRNAAATRIQRYFRSRKDDAQESLNESDVSLLLEPKIFYKGHRNARTMIKEANFWGDDFILSGSDCGRIFIWDKHSGELVSLLEGDRHVVNCVQPHPFDPILATSGIDHDVKIWAPVLPEPAVLQNVDEIIRRNEQMLEESRFTITVPASFMLRMLTSIHRVRSFRRQQQNQQQENDDESEEDE